MGAGEWLLARVGPHVTLQEPGPGEGLAALGALARQRVGADVHFQGGLGVVRLLTILAAELFLDLVGGVQVLVLDIT